MPYATPHDHVYRTREGHYRHGVGPQRGGVDLGRGTLQSSASLAAMSYRQELWSGWLARRGAAIGGQLDGLVDLDRTAKRRRGHRLNMSSPSPAGYRRPCSSMCSPCSSVWICGYRTGRRTPRGPAPRRSPSHLAAERVELSPGGLHTLVVEVIGSSPPARATRPSRNAAKASATAALSRSPNCGPSIKKIRTGPPVGARPGSKGPTGALFARAGPASPHLTGVSQTTRTRWTWRRADA